MANLSEKYPATVGRLTWYVITTDTTASKDCGYMVNAGSGAVDVTFPASPAVGNTVGIKILDLTNAVVLKGNGSNIESSAADLTIDIAHAGMVFVYADATRGWVNCTEINGGETVKQITEDTTIYVATTGSDSTGDGTSGSPYYSPAKAMAHLDEYVIIGNVLVTIDIADGTYNSLATVNVLHPQANRIEIVGNVTTPANVVLNFTSAQTGFYIWGVTLKLLTGVTVETFGNGICLLASDGTFVKIDQCVFDTNTAAAGGTCIIMQNASHCVLSTITCRNAYFGLRVYANSSAMCGIGITITANYYGMYVDMTSNVSLNTAPVITSNTVGLLAYYKSNIWITSESLFSGNTTNSSPAASTAVSPVFGNIQSSIAKTS